MFKTDSLLIKVFSIVEKIQYNQLKKLYNVYNIVIIKLNLLSGRICF